MTVMIFYSIEPSLFRSRNIPNITEDIERISINPTFSDKINTEKIIPNIDVVE